MVERAPALVQRHFSVKNLDDEAKLAASWTDSTQAAEDENSSGKKKKDKENSVFSCKNLGALFGKMGDTAVANMSMTPSPDNSNRSSSNNTNNSNNAHVCQNRDNNFDLWMNIVDEERDKAAHKNENVKEKGKRKDREGEGEEETKEKERQHDNNFMDTFRWNRPPAGGWEHAFANVNANREDSADSGGPANLNRVNGALTGMTMLLSEAPPAVMNAVSACIFDRDRMPSLEVEDLSVGVGTGVGTCSIYIYACVCFYYSFN